MSIRCIRHPTLTADDTTTSVAFRCDSLRQSGPLKAQGIVVTPNQVSNIKYQMGLKKKGRKKAAAPEAAASEAPIPKDAISLSALLEAKKLVAKLGSTEMAKKPILALAQLGE
jgi:hypothetical protein